MEVSLERRDIFRRVLEAPKVYSLFQDFVSATSTRERIAAEVLRVQTGERVLDVGCGPADILEVLPSIDYVGIDYSPAYIESAREKFGGRGRFILGDVSTLQNSGETGFDVAMAIGVLHHLDDHSARALMKAVKGSLKKNGRFICIDPLIEYPQNPVARMLARLDRGQFVRTLEGYSNIAGSAFTDFSVEPRRDLLRVPYSHAITVCYAGHARV